MFIESINCKEKIIDGELVNDNYTMLADIRELLEAITYLKKIPKEHYIGGFTADSLDKITNIQIKADKVQANFS
jgi:hypothetical protein